MRETKEQKIARLEKKIIEQENTIASKKSAIRELKQLIRHHTELAEKRRKRLLEYKKQVKKQDQLLAEKDSSIKKQSNIIGQLRLDLKIRSNGQQSRFSSSYIAIDQSRLDSLYAGLPEDKYGCLYYDTNNLLLRINPFSGNTISTNEKIELQEFLNTEYLDIYSDLLSEASKTIEMIKHLPNDNRLRRDLGEYGFRLFRLIYLDPHIKDIFEYSKYENDDLRELLSDFEKHSEDDSFRTEMYKDYEDDNLLF